MGVGRGEFEDTPAWRRCLYRPVTQNVPLERTKGVADPFMGMAVDDFGCAKPSRVLQHRGLGHIGPVLPLLLVCSALCTHGFGLSEP